MQGGEIVCRHAGLFRQTADALGASVGLLFQIAQLVFGAGDGREGFVALAYRGVQLTLRGLYLGLQAGERCGSLGVLLLQSGKTFAAAPDCSCKPARLLAAASVCCSRSLSWFLALATAARVLSRSLIAASN